MFAHVFLLLFVVVMGAEWGCIWSYFFPKFSLIDLSLLSLILTICCPTVNFWPQYMEISIIPTYPLFQVTTLRIDIIPLSFLMSTSQNSICTPYPCNQGGISLSNLSSHDFYFCNRIPAFGFIKHLVYIRNFCLSNIILKGFFFDLFVYFLSWVLYLMTL